MTLSGKLVVDEGERFRMTLADEPDPVTLELLGGGID